MNYIVVPLFSTMANLMPQLKHLEKNGKDNAVNWVEYKETEEDKEIYKPKTILKEELI